MEVEGLGLRVTMTISDLLWAQVYTLKPKSPKAPNQKDVKRLSTKNPASSFSFSSSWPPDHKLVKVGRYTAGILGGF